jgi:glutamine synthetase
VYSSREKSKRIEYRMPDGAANPYLAFSAVLMAMLDGIVNKTHPGPPLDKDIYDLPAEQLKDVPKPPRSLDEALTALEKDHGFLTRGDVFTEDVIETWVAFKRQEEVEAVRLRPHPYEFALYYDS